MSASKIFDVVYTSRRIDDNVGSDVRLDASDVDGRVGVRQLESEDIEEITFLQTLPDFYRRRVKCHSDKANSPVENLNQSDDWNAGEKSWNQMNSICCVFLIFPAKPNYEVVY